MSDRDRNKPCWCGSGLKLKKCHLDRELQKRPAIWEAQRLLSKNSERRVCLHPSAHGSNCADTIAKAHTVRRAADLKSIARDGHVYQTALDIGTIDKNNGDLSVELIGINNASTFRGFCSKHDSATFAPIETADLVLTDEQAFLLAYRPLCKELYAKEAQMESMALIRQSDKGRSTIEQVATQQFASLMEAGIEAGLKDLRRHKAAFDSELVASDFAQMRFVLVRLDCVPDIMCSAVLQPDYSFEGEVIQDIGDLSVELQLVSVTLAATATGGAAVFAWRADSDAAASQLVDSLLRISHEQIPHAIVRYILSNVENAFFRPQWWEGLSTEQREYASARLKQNVGPDDTVGSRYLEDDSLRIVNWQIAGISHKRT
jgi:hypothetical protein